MTKAWWEKILYNYPQSLEACKKYFQHRYQDQWRDRIQNYLLVIEFFEANYIPIYIHWKHHQSGKKYGFKIQVKGTIKIQMDYVFSDSEKAAVEAIPYAFKILEWRISQGKYRVKIDGYGRREKRK